MLNEYQIKKILKETGHWDYPFGEQMPLGDVPLDSPEGRYRVESYQDFLRPTLELITTGMHPERLSVTAKIDGVVGPVTMALFETPRCGMPDYGFGFDAEAVGLGAWKRCHDIGEFHACSVRFINSPPSWLAPLLPEVLKRVQAAYDEAGLRFYFAIPGETPKSPVNIEAEFVGSSGGWIGLAILGSRSQTCTAQPLWCKYLHTYTGGSSDEARIQQWTSLIKHELGHNCRYNHTSGGVMNPSIIPGLPTSWKNDVLWPSLKADFGGEPVEPIPPPQPPVPPSPPTGVERVTIERDSQGKYRLLSVWE